MHRLVLSVSTVLVSLAFTQAEDDQPFKERMLRPREKDIWARCDTAEKGICTLFMATGKKIGPFEHNYRNFAVFDHECELTGLYYTERDESEVTLDSHLEDEITVEVDEGVDPEGTIKYGGEETSLGDELDCYDYEGLTDGHGCKRQFPC